MGLCLCISFALRGTFVVSDFMVFDVHLARSYHHTMRPCIRLMHINLPCTSALPIEDHIKYRRRLWLVNLINNIMLSARI
ncbi:hypothetical protein DER45DRAFT_358061 [Fusarium avenaceum]|nr:hypothetical protein DER45DRAFT_358061 [Fusarium avenaceum]